VAGELGLRLQLIFQLVVAVLSLSVPRVMKPLGDRLGSRAGGPEWRAAAFLKVEKVVCAGPASWYTCRP